MLSVLVHILSVLVHILRLKSAEDKPRMQVQASQTQVNKHCLLIKVAILIKEHLLRSLYKNKEFVSETRFILHNCWSYIPNAFTLNNLLISNTTCTSVEKRNQHACEA